MNQTISVAGAGLAELPIPAWLRLVRTGIALGLFGLILTATFLLSGWGWVTDAGADGLSPGFALWCAVIVTTATAAPISALRLGLIDRLLNIRRNSSDRSVFGGFRSKMRLLAVLTTVPALLATSGLLTYQSIRTCPLPEVFSKLRFEVAAPTPNEKLVPVYFWDYATWIDPEWFKQINLVIPYEKGPPQKLLPKIFFEDAQTHSIVLELHGKRPRAYSPNEVFSIFNSESNAPVVHPRDWPLVWRLEREAGLTTDGLSAPILSLLRFSQGLSSEVTQAIGVPWEATSTQPRPESGRVFFWGPDGSVFQVKCPTPCPMTRLLELVQFPRDPRGSQKERLEWTKETLKKLLDQIEQNPAARSANENLLSLYLVSLLTLDPRDPEAFFHLGKLARNRTTALATIRYGRDLGLEHAKLLELEGVADRLSF